MNPMLLMMAADGMKWFAKNPVQTLQLAGIAALAAVAVFFYFDYTNAKAQVRTLRTEVTAQRALAEAQDGRLQDFVEAQEASLERLQAIEARSRQIRIEVRQLTDELSAPNINIIVEESPDEAAAIITRRFDDILSLLDDASRPD